MGCVYRRGKKWYGKYRAAGKQIQRVLPEARSKREAQIMLAHLMGQGVAGTGTTFADFAGQWLSYIRPRVKPRTAEGYRQDVTNDLVPVLGSRRLRDLGAADIQALVTSVLGREASPATVNKKLRTLRSMLNQAVEWNVVARPVRIRLLRQERKEMRFLSREQVDKLIAALPEAYRALVELAVFAGPRQGELLALRWSDINWERSEIAITRTRYGGHYTSPKTHSSRRVVSVAPQILAKLKPHADLPDSPIFTNRDGKPLDRSNLVQRVFEPALAAAGLPRIRWHDLRHTYVALANSVGVDAKTIQAQIGHSQITTTMDGYGHLFPAHRAAAAERIYRGV
jgi:integrase